jgi:hypothetical protein
MTYTYNPDDTLNGLIEHFAWDRDTAQLLPVATESELEALSDEITRRLEVNAATVATLVSQDDTPDAAYLHLCFCWTLGGCRVWVDCEVSNVGETGGPIINIIPTITRKED